MSLLDLRSGFSPFLRTVGLKGFLDAQTLLLYTRCVCACRQQAHPALPLASSARLPPQPKLSLVPQHRVQARPTALPLLE